MAESPEHAETPWATPQGEALKAVEPGAAAEPGAGDASSSSNQEASSAAALVGSYGAAAPGPTEIAAEPLAPGPAAAPELAPVRSDADSSAEASAPTEPAVGWPAEAAEAAEVAEAAEAVDAAEATIPTPQPFLSSYAGVVPSAAPDTTQVPDTTTAPKLAEAPELAGTAPASIHSTALNEPPSPAPAPGERAGIAASLVVPPLASAAAGEGGEWDLLIAKLRAWFDGADLQGRWESLGGPLRTAGLLGAAVVLIRLYSALLETLGDLPLLPRLLQLVGLITLARFCLTSLVRSSDRERILSGWRTTWNDFRGRA